MLIWGIPVIIGTFFFMEFVAWATHKYIMHGLLWYLHKDHHQPEPGFFEKNDAFFLIFAIPSWLGIMLGMIYSYYVFVFIGFGIAVYGFAYFLIHDVFIHRRANWLKQINHPYFMALRKAHKIHHKKREKEDGECFGMLLVPPRFYAEAKKSFLNKLSKK